MTQNGSEVGSVSVVIPTFNRQHDTLRAIASALAQGPVVGEVIVVDDGSMPAFVLDGGKIQVSRVKLIRVERNQGTAAARNHGWRAATRPWLAFLDSDDAWLPGKLENQLALAEERAQGLVAFSCAWVGSPVSDRPSKRIPSPGLVSTDFLSGCWFCPGSTLLIPRFTFERIGPFDERLRRLEDLEWFIRFGQAGGALHVSERAGALITFGSRAMLAPVLTAVQVIRESFIDGAAPLAFGQARKLNAYLYLECAAAARNEGHWIAAAAYLARSFILVPRFRLHQRAFWRKVPWTNGLDLSPTEASS